MGMCVESLYMAETWDETQSTGRFSLNINVGARSMWKACRFRLVLDTHIHTLAFWGNRHPIPGDACFTHEYGCTGSCIQWVKTIDELVLLIASVDTRVGCSTHC